MARARLIHGAWVIQRLPRGPCAIGCDAAIVSGPSLAAADPIVAIHRLFHIGARPARPAADEAVRAPLPSLLELEVEWEEQGARGRGVAAESWRRARAWSSED